MTMTDERETAEWIVEPDQIDFGDATYAVTDASGDIKALCFTEGTAALIAAAPALLEALEGLTDSVEHGGECPSCGGDPRFWLNDWSGHDPKCGLLNARAAIRAARGEE